MDVKNEFEINTSQSFHVFQKLNDKKVAVITIAGEARSGKSFLANRLLQKQEAFQLGSNVAACTKGIWMWSQPIHLHDDVYALIMDCEGMNSADKDTTFDNNLLTITVLLSSMLVFNQKMVLSSDTFASLAKVASVTKHLSTQSGMSLAFQAGSRFADLFPDLVVVLRDFQSNIKQDGFNTVREYFENGLKTINPADSGKNNISEKNIKSMNAQRSIIKQCFRNRDAYGIVIPTTNQQKLKNIEKQDFSSLRPAFQQQVTQLISNIKSKVRYKTVQGNQMNGTRLKEMIYAYIEAINSGQTPHIPSTVQQVLLNEARSQSEQLFQEMQEDFDNQFDPVLLPYEQDKQQNILWSSYDQKIDTLHKKYFNLISTKRLISETQQFGKKSLTEFQSKQLINYQNSAKMSNYYFKQLLNDINMPNLDFSLNYSKDQESKQKSTKSAANISLQQTIQPQQSNRSQLIPSSSATTRFQQDPSPDALDNYINSIAFLIDSLYSKQTGPAKSDFISDFIFSTQQLRNQLSLQQFDQKTGAERGDSRLLDDSDLQYAPTNAGTGMIHLGYHLSSVGPGAKNQLQMQLFSKIKEAAKMYALAFKELINKKELKVESKKAEIKRLDRQKQSLNKKILKHKENIQEIKEEIQDFTVNISRHEDFITRQQENDKISMMKKEKDLKKLQEKLAQKNEDAENLRLQISKIEADCENMKKEYEMLEKQNDNIKKKKQQVNELEIKAKKLEPLKQLKENPSYKEISTFFDNIEEHLLGTIRDSYPNLNVDKSEGDIDLIDIEALEQRKLQLQNQLNSQNLQTSISMIDIEIQDEDDDSQGDYTRKLQAIDNQIQGNKRDKAKLDFHIQKNNNQIQRLKLELKKQQEGFEKKCEELQKLKMNSMKKTNTYMQMSNEIDSKKQKLLGLQADITETSMKFANMMEDNDYLVSLAPLLENASKKNQKIAINLKRLSAESRQDLLEVAGEYIKK